MKLKKIAITFALVLGVTSITAFAASAYETPAEAAAGLTGRTVESVTEEKLETGKTYGTIANEAGKLDAFKAEMLEMKKTLLQKKVADGVITQAQADEILAALEQNLASCDGSGEGKCGLNSGLGFGRKNGNGRGPGKGTGQGLGRGNGQGMGKGQGRGSGQGLCNGMGMNPEN